MNTTDLLMPFIDESESFVHGFECGMIWQQVSEGERLESYLFHAANIKQVEMICELYGVAPAIRQVDDTWAYLTIKSASDGLQGVD